MALVDPDVMQHWTRRGAQVTVDRERCAGCQECIVRCPVGALHLDETDWVCVPQPEDCVACRQCERTCPYGAIEVEGRALVPPPAALHEAALAHDRLRPTQEVKPGFADWDDALAEAGRCLQCPDPTCRLGCPAHNDIPGFIAALRDRNLAQAHDVLRQTTVFPDICSRVCDQSIQCEGACSWNLAGAAPVRIGLLERFIADRHPVPPPALPARRIGLSVGVVGAGPAGLAAAWELLGEGAEVVVYERAEQPLGVLGWGIPSFTLPDQVAQRPLKALLDAGLEIRSGVAVGRQKPVQELLSSHDAVILAHGAALPIPLQVPGGDAVRSEDSTSFLTRAKEALRTGQRLPDVAPGTHILVIGAGNTAMDVARSARRLGADVLAVEWMDRRFAKVRADELEQAEREGVRIRFSTVVRSFEPGNGIFFRARLGRTVQRSARNRPKIVPSPPDEIGMIELVVLATGYRVDNSPLAGLHLSLPKPPAEPPRFRDRRLLASGLPQGSEAMARRVEERAAASVRAGQPVGHRIYAVGDALTGPATVVAAMTQGRAAARAVVGEWRRGGLRPSSWLQREAAAVVATPAAAGEGRAQRPLRLTSFALLGTGSVFCLTVIGFMAGVLLLASGAFLLILDLLGAWVQDKLQQLGELPAETQVPALGRRLRS